MKIIYSLPFVAVVSISQCMDDVAVLVVDKQKKTCELNSSSSLQESNKAANETYSNLISFDLERFLGNPSVAIGEKKYPVYMSAALISSLKNKEGEIEEKLMSAINDIMFNGVSEIVSHIELLLIDGEISIQPVRKKW